jgi:hypothetical protein
MQLLGFWANPHPAARQTGCNLARIGMSRIRLLFKKEISQRELVDVNDIIRGMIELLRSEATRYSISMRTELSEDLPQIMGDRVQLQQVTMNLIIKQHRCDEGCGQNTRDSHHVSAGGKRSSSSVRQRYRHRASLAAGGPDLQCVFYNQTSRHRHGTTDQPLHH